MTTPAQVDVDQATQEDRATAKATVQVMDGRPLAFDQAGAYIDETGCTLSHYLTLYRTHRQAM